MSPAQAFFDRPSSSSHHDRLHVFKTSFTTTMRCPEGFRCVSRITKFGKDHFGDVDPTAAADVFDKSIKDYEWNCPGEGKDRPQWREYEYIKGLE